MPFDLDSLPARGEDPNDLGPVYEDAGRQHGIDPLLLRAQDQAESGGNDWAISHAGAQGRAQFMPETAREMGIDPWDRRQAIYGQARYLRQAMDKFGSPSMAIAAYNAGPNNPSRFSSPAVQDYVADVARRYNELRQAHDQSAKPAPSGLDDLPNAKPLSLDDLPEKGKARPADTMRALEQGATEPQGRKVDWHTLPQAQKLEEPQSYQPVEGGGQGWVQDPVSGAFIPPEAAKVDTSDNPVSRIAQAAKEGWNESNPLFSPEFQYQLETSHEPITRFVIAPLAKIVSGAIAGGGAAIGAQTQAIRELGSLVGLPDLPEDLMALPGVAGVEAPMGIHAAQEIAAGNRAARETIPPTGQVAPTPTPEPTGVPPPTAETPPTAPSPAPRQDLADIAAGKPPSQPAMPTLERMAADAVRENAKAEAPEPQVTPVPPTEKQLAPQILAAERQGLTPVYDANGQWVGYENQQKVAPVPEKPPINPEEPPRPTPTTPEPAGDIRAQVEALKDPQNPKDAVFVAPGSERGIPRGLPDSIEVVRRPEGTLLTDNVEKAAAFREAEGIDDAFLADILGYPETKQEAGASGKPQVVQGTDNQGNVVHAALASPEGVPEAARAVAAQAPNVEVVSPIEAQQRRAARVAEEQATPAQPELPGVPAIPLEEQPAIAGAAVRSRTNQTPFVQVPREPVRLNDYLRRPTVIDAGTVNQRTIPGGLRDEGADINAILGGTKGRPGLINNASGRTLDDAAQAAWEDGYLPGAARPDINALKDAIAQDHNGNPVYSERDLEAAHAYREALGRNAETARLASEYDIPTQGLTVEQFYDELADRMSLEEAARQAEGIAAAHEADYAALQHGLEGHADEYYEGEPRTLEDLENEFGQEEAAPAEAERAGGAEQPVAAAEPAGLGENGAGQGERGAEPGQRGEAEAATDLLGRPVQPKRGRAGPEPTIRNDERQTLIPGTEASAVQAQAARDAQGRGALQTEVPQKAANEGLFAPDTSGQGDFYRSTTTLYSFPGMLADPEAWRGIYRATLPAIRPIVRLAGKAVDATMRVSDAIANWLAPIRTGTSRARAFAADFASALRNVHYHYGEIDREIERRFTPAQRAEMGRAMDEQSVFEQTISVLTPEEQAAAREAFDRDGRGVAGLPPQQQQVLRMLDSLSQQTWRRMQERGMVAPTAQGLPFYMPRQFYRWSEENGFSNTSKGAQGSGRGIQPIGTNLTTAGPMSREHLTPEESLAGARAKLGEDVQLLTDIRSLPARLAFANRAIAGVDLLNKIEEVGRDVGVGTVIRGDIPGLLNPADYFTIADHPAFRRWTGSGWQAVNVAREFEGPLKAVLTAPTGDLYRYAQVLKGGVMSAIMYSPFIHLSVEVGRTLPVMPGKVLSLQWIKQGATLRKDFDYMEQAIRDGVAPLAHTGGWSTDPASLADQSFGQSRSAFVRGIQSMRDAVANGARAIGGDTLHDIVQHPHQALLWDQVFNLQMSIYDEMRNRYMQKGFEPEVAGTMAAHLANRYAGALPQENLGRTANMMANILLFSRSFTLGNLGVIKDALTGAPPHVLSRIEQMAGPQVAKSAKIALRRKAIATVALDIGLFYAGVGLVQTMLQAYRQGADQTEDEFIQHSKMAWNELAGGNPLAIFHFLPQHWNEPGKQDRVYAGTDSDGRGVYLRLPPGKVGEEFVGWDTKPGVMLLNKLSPLVRPVIEDIIGHDSLGRDLYPPNPQTIGDGARIAWLAVKHIAESLGPTSTIEGGIELAKHYIFGQPSHGDAGTSALKVLGPTTGLAQVSSGFPGGPEAGKIHGVIERQKYEVQQALPGIRDKIKSGDIDGARDDMNRLGIPPGLQRFYLQSTLNPGPTRGSIKRFLRSATPEERASAGLPQ